MFYRKHIEKNTHFWFYKQSLLNFQKVYVFFFGIYVFIWKMFKMFKTSNDFTPMNQFFIIFLDR